MHLILSSPLTAKHKKLELSKKVKTNEKWLFGFLLVQAQWLNLVKVHFLLLI
jgi:hypothetical protein